MKHLIALLLMGGTYGSMPEACTVPHMTDRPGDTEMVRLNDEGIAGLEWGCDFTGINGNVVTASCGAEGEDFATTFVVVVSGKTAQVTDRGDGATYTLTRCPD